MSRIRTFIDRVPTGQVLKSGLLLVVLFLLCFLLPPPERILTAVVVLLGVLAIPGLASDALLGVAPTFVAVSRWAPLAGFAALVFLRKPIAADFRLGLLVIAVLGLYLGAYFWLFSNPKLWQAIDEAAEPHDP